jgi:hypothetical protein
MKVRLAIAASVVALAISACASEPKSKQPGPQISVSGMTRYEDAGFGFSFWYPSAWTVTPQPTNNCAGRPRPVSCPDDPGVLQEGVIVRQFMVGNGKNGVVIQEFRSSSVSIAERGMGASPFGEDVRYLFDPTTRNWMRTILRSPMVQEPFPVTSPADVSQKTMGGLPVLEGTSRHGADSIVPLNPSDFVIVESIDPGNPDQRYLARTILATDPSAAPRESAETQERLINAWRLHSEGLQ